MLQLGRVIAKYFAEGSQEAISPDLGNALASQPDSAADIVRLLFVETRKKRANLQQVHAFSFMLEKALETARWRIENRSASANDLIDKVREAIVEEAAGTKGNTKALLAIAGSFAAAKVELGASLNKVIENADATDAGPQAGADFAQMHRQFEATLGLMARELDHDPFLIHDQITTMLATFPLEAKIEIISMMAVSPAPSVRESVVGFLLDPAASIGNAVAGFLAQAATKGLVSGETISRLVTLRNWISDDRRTAVDAVIRASRLKEISIPSRPAVQINNIIVSACDGAGAQSFFVKLRDKKKFAVASLLVKHGYGLRDAWVRRGLSGAEAEMFLAQIKFDLSNFGGSLEIVRTALEHGLAFALVRGETIPFGLVQFVEATGLGSVAPQEYPPEALLDRLMAEVSLGKAGDTEIARVLARSKQWGKSLPWFELWFEDSEEAVRAIKRGAKKKDKVENVLRDVLPSRRQYWGELLAWTAFGASDDDTVGEIADLILVARELLDTRPLSEIPLANLIAKSTVEVLHGR
jgi:hypothetical protein